jgi:hypothetical protein
MGQRVAKLKPVDGFAAESSAALTLAISSGFGIPVSTTHVITGAISGVGSAKRLRAVRWGVTFRIVWAWIFDYSGSFYFGWNHLFLLWKTWLEIRIIIGIFSLVEIMPPLLTARGLEFLTGFTLDSINEMRRPSPWKQEQLFTNI